MYILVVKCAPISTASSSPCPQTIIRVGSHLCQPRSSTSVGLTKIKPFWLLPLPATPVDISSSGPPPQGCIFAHLGWGGIVFCHFLDARLPNYCHLHRGDNLARNSTGSKRDPTAFAFYQQP